MSVSTQQEVTTTTKLLLPYASASVAAARRKLAKELRSRGLGGTLVDDAALVLSEILSNALRHARPLTSGKIEVGWQIRGVGVEIAVTDGGASTRPTPARASVSSLGGRGLGIVSTLTADWGVREGDGATTVWALVPYAGSGVGLER